MKTKKSVLISAICGILFFSCNTETKEQTTEQKTETLPPVQEETLCFEYNYQGKKKNDYKKYSIQLTLKGDSITGSYANEEYEGRGDGEYNGYRKADTLFLSTIYHDFVESDEPVVPTLSLWLLQSDKLSQFETIDKNGKEVLKNPANPKIILTYNKTNCK